MESLTGMNWPAVVSLSVYFFSFTIGIFLAFLFGLLIGRAEERDKQSWLWLLLWSKEAAIIDLEQRLQMVPDHKETAGKNN
jgi:hypothetical protein